MYAFDNVLYKEFISRHCVALPNDVVTLQYLNLEFKSH
jgi:hypothetical protein